jgi:hypothetical protein
MELNAKSKILPVLSETYAQISKTRLLLVPLLGLASKAPLMAQHGPPRGFAH